MDNEMRCVEPLDQPWWRVRAQLLVVLALLTAICVALWTDSPVRRWMVSQVVQAELPEGQLFAQANQR